MGRSTEAQVRCIGDIREEKEAVGVEGMQLTEQNVQQFFKVLLQRLCSLRNPQGLHVLCSLQSSIKPRKASYQCQREP